MSPFAPFNEYTYLKKKIQNKMWLVIVLQKTTGLQTVERTRKNLVVYEPAHRNLSF